MVTAHQELTSLEPPLKLGHDDGQALLQKDGYPSAGWLKNVRRSGSKLYGDLKKIPAKLAGLIDAKAYRKLSPEIYWNLKAGGKVYKRAIKALSLLGADIPANLDLKDFASLYAGKDFDAVQSYSFEAVKSYHNKEGTMDAEQTKELEQLRQYKADAEKQLAEKEKVIAEARTKEYSAKVESLYSELKEYMVPASRGSFEALCALPSGLKSYTASDKSEFDMNDPLSVVRKFVTSLPKVNVEGPVTRHFDAQEERRNTAQADENPAAQADKELNARIKEYRKANPSVSYTEAAKLVTRGDE